MRLLLLAFASCLSAQTIIPNSTAFGGWPLGPYGTSSPRGCQVAFSTTAYGASAYCYGGAQCQRPNYFNRTGLFTSASVAEYCTNGVQMDLTAHGEILGTHGISSAAFLNFATFFRAKGVYNVFHDSSDDCNQAGPYNNSAQAKPCPPGLLQ